MERGERTGDVETKTDVRKQHEAVYKEKIPKRGRRKKYKNSVINSGTYSPHAKRVRKKMEKVNAVE